MKRDSNVPMRSRAPLKWPTWALQPETKVWAGNLLLAFACAAIVVVCAGAVR